jgi:predicted Zn-dependent peptidase
MESITCGGCMEQTKIHQMANGLKVIVVNKPERHSVLMEMFIKTGVRWESEENIGITHLTEHILFKGTAAYPSTLEYAKAIANIGGDVNAETSAETVTYSFWVGRKKYLEGLELFLGLFTEPLIKEEDLKLEKKVIMAELRECYEVDTYIEDLLWQDHPLGFSIKEEKRNLKNLTIEDVQKHFNTFYVPNNMVLVVLGPVDSEEVIKQISLIMGKLQPGKLPLSIPFTPSNNDAKIKFQKADKKVMDIDLAFYGYPYNHPRSEALILLKDILGNGPTSRLFLRLREELGLVYGVDAKVTRWQDSGAFQIQYTSSKANLVRALKNVVKEIRDVKQELVCEDELERAKGWRIACLENEYDSVKAIMERYGVGHLYDDFTDIQEDIRKVEEVKIEEIKEVAQEIFRYNCACFLLTGPQLKAEEKRTVNGILRGLS